MATAYSVFANGGYRVNPWIISKVTDQRGKVLTQVREPMLDESQRVIDARNAFVMDSLLQEVTRTGTAASAQAALKRPDLYGKTGTTNDSMDAWFAGFQPSLTAITWVGYDTPRKLGRRETGGGLSLPIWIEFMSHALNGVPVTEPDVPAGVVNIDGEWFYDAYTNTTGITTLGVESEGNAPQVIPMPYEEEKKKILDLFKN